MTESVVATVVGEGDVEREAAQLEALSRDDGAVEWLARSRPIEDSRLSRLTLVGLGRATAANAVESVVLRDCLCEDGGGSVLLEQVEFALRVSAAARAIAFRRWASATPGGGWIRLIRASTGSDVVELGMLKCAPFNRLAASAWNIQLSKCRNATVDL